MRYLYWGTAIGPSGAASVVRPHPGLRERVFPPGRPIDGGVGTGAGCGVPTRGAVAVPAGVAGVGADILVFLVVAGAVVAGSVGVPGAGGRRGIALARGRTRQVGRGDRREGDR